MTTPASFQSHSCQKGYSQANGGTSYSKICRLATAAATSRKQQQQKRTRSSSSSKSSPFLAAKAPLLAGPPRAPTPAHLASNLSRQPRPHGAITGRHRSPYCRAAAAGWALCSLPANCGTGQKLFAGRQKCAPKNLSLAGVQLQGRIQHGDRPAPMAVAAAGGVHCYCHYKWWSRGSPCGTAQ